MAGRTWFGLRPPSSITRGVWQLFGLMIFIVVLSSGALSWGLHLLNQARAAISRTETIERNLRALGQDLLDAESGERGFLLTGDDRYLGPYRVGIANISSRIDILRQNIIDISASKALDRIIPIVSAKVNELQKTVILMQGGNRDAALKIFVEGTGTSLMDEFRNIQSDIISIELRLLNDRHDNENEKSLFIVLTLIVGVMIILMVLYGFIHRLTVQLGHPVAELMAGMQSVAAGLFDRELTVRGQDEIGQITKAFNVMVQRLIEMTTARDTALLEVQRRNEELRKAEQAARNNEERLRIIIENVPAMISYVDRQERYRYINPRFCEWTGLDEADVLGRTLRDIYGETVYSGFAPMIQSVFSGCPANNQREVHGVSGSRWVSVSMVPHFDLNSEVIGFYALSYDITERYKSENALKESEHRLQLIADNIPGLISQLDKDLRYRFVNRSYGEWFGIRHESLIGISLREFYGDAVFASISDPLHRALGGETITSEWEIPTKNGSRYCHVVLIPQHGNDGDVVGLFAIKIDITARRGAELALRTSQSLLARTGAIAGVGGWELDLITGSVTWSDQTCLLHDVAPGYSPSVEEAIGFYTPHSRSQIEQAVRDAIDHGLSWDLELELVSAKGRPFWARATGAVECENGTPVRLLGAFQDVTEVVLARRQLREQSENLAATLENIDQGIVRVAADRKIEFLNRRFVELLDIPLDLVRKPSPHFDEVLGYLDQQGEFAEVDENLRKRARARGEPLLIGTHRRTRPNGQILEVVASQLGDGSVVATYSDITARHRAEQAVRESELRYRTLADATSDVITQLDLNLVRRYVSPACRTMLGYEPEEMLGISPAATVHPEDAAMMRNAMELLLSGEMHGDKATITNRMRHKSGHWVWLEAGINLVRDPETAAPLALICSLRDVTERQRTARHLERATKAAEEATRAKSEFVANMSHELRTPLTGIMGVHDVLRADPTLSAGQRRLVDLANDAGRSLQTIVDDILDLSKIEAGQLAIAAIPFDLEELIESCGSLARESLKGKPITITTNVQPSLSGSWIGDPIRLRQILMNLLTNAVKFTARGTIAVVAISKAESKLLRVEVTDTGIGIPPDRIDRLFERFVQADASVTRRFGGTGLGLAISKRLLDLMGGRISAENRPEGGSLFCFEVPLKASILSADGSAGSDTHVVPPKTLNILLAEDNPINSEILQTMLATRGHRVTAVEDGNAALTAAQGTASFDVILMDMQMPVMDGLTATSTLRKIERDESRRRMPIIGLTANAMAEDVERCLSVGMDGHVAKPINWSKLFSTLTEVIAAASTSSEVAALTHNRAKAKVLDEVVLNNLIEMIGREKVANFLERFIADMSKRMKDFARLEAQEIVRHAHSIGGLAGQLGFIALADLCQTIEMEAMQGTAIGRVAKLSEAMQCAIVAAHVSPHRHAA